MNNQLENKAKELLKSPEGAKLLEKKDEIAKLANSKDGLKVQEMLSREYNIQDAVQRGDLDALRNAVTQLLQTDAGANLANQLGNLMK